MTRADPVVVGPKPASAEYRSGFYWTNDEQKQLILASKEAYEKALGRKITTECAAASDYDKYGGVFYYAEDYHRASARYYPALCPRPSLWRTYSRADTLSDRWICTRRRAIPRQTRRAPVLLRSAAVRVAATLRELGAQGAARETHAQA